MGPSRVVGGSKVPPSSGTQHTTRVFLIGSTWLTSPWSTCHHDYDDGDGDDDDYDDDDGYLNGLLQIFTKLFSIRIGHKGVSYGI